MKSICVFICFLLWLIATVLLSITIIGMAVTADYDWTEIGHKIIDKL